MINWDTSYLDFLLNLIFSENIMNCTVLLRTSSSVFIASYHTSTVALFPAYGSYARSTSGNQNVAVLPKRHDDSLFSTANKNKDNMKVPFAFSSSPFGLNRTRNYFVRNKTTIILPGDTRRTMSDLPC